MESVKAVKRINISKLTKATKQSIHEIVPADPSCVRQDACLGCELTSNVGGVNLHRCERGVLSGRLSLNLSTGFPNIRNASSQLSLIYSGGLIHSHIIDKYNNMSRDISTDNDQSRSKIPALALDGEHRLGENRVSSEFGTFCTCLLVAEPNLEEGVSLGRKMVFLLAL